jgi:hypothetical protein
LHHGARKCFGRQRAAGGRVGLSADAARRVLDDWEHRARLPEPVARWLRLIIQFGIDPADVK